MRNIIKYNGRLYAPLEEGAYTVQGEIVHVVASSRPDERDELILKMRETLSWIKKILPDTNEQIDQYLQERSHELYHLLCVDVPHAIDQYSDFRMPASTKKMEAMQRVIEAARKLTLDYGVPLSEAEELKKALEALGA